MGKESLHSMLLKSPFEHETGFISRFRYAIAVKALKKISSTESKFMTRYSAVTRWHEAYSTHSTETYSQRVGLLERLLKSEPSFYLRPKKSSTDSPLAVFAMKYRRGHYFVFVGECDTIVYCGRGTSPDELRSFVNRLYFAVMMPVLLFGRGSSTE